VAIAPCVRCTGKWRWHQRRFKRICPSWRKFNIWP